MLTNKRNPSILIAFFNGVVERAFKGCGVGNKNHFGVWLSVNGVYEEKNKRKFKIDELMALVLENEKTEIGRLVCKSLQKLNLAYRQCVVFSKDEVKALSSFIQFLENPNEKYEMLIKNYDRIIKSKKILNSLDARHINNGWGRGTLGPKRIIKINNENLFEKCYFLNSVELKKLIFVNKYIAKHVISKNFSTPLLKDLVYGEMLVLSYSEEISISRCDSSHACIGDDVIELAVNFSLAMLELDVNWVIHFFEKGELFENVFLESSSYNLFSRLLKQGMFSEIMLIRKIEYLLSDNYLSVAHGDFSFPNNIVVGGLIFDWDDLCVQPYGYDLGYLLGIKVKPDYLFEVIRRVKIYCFDKLTQDQMKYFIRGVIYFYIIFYFSREVNIEITLKAFLKCLIDEVDEFRIVDESNFIVG